MILEVLGGGVVVAAGGFVVTSAYSRVERFSILIDVEGEAALAFACRAGVSALHACVFLE